MAGKFGQEVRFVYGSLSFTYSALNFKVSHLERGGGGGAGRGVVLNGNPFAGIGGFYKGDPRMDAEGSILYRHMPPPYSTPHLMTIADVLFFYAHIRLLLILDKHDIILV